MLILPLPGRFTLIVRGVEVGNFMIPVYVCAAADAVPRERIAAPGAVARSAAVVSEAPVAHHAPVTMWPGHPRLARAVTIAGVTEGH